MITRFLSQHTQTMIKTLNHTPFLKQPAKLFRHDFLPKKNLDFLRNALNINNLQIKGVKMNKEKIENLTQHWINTLQTQSPKEVVNLYTDDAILIPTVSNKIRESKEAKLNYFETFLQKKPKADIVESTVTLNADGATHTGKYVFNLETEKGPESVTCRFTFQFKQIENGEWKITHHHSSLNPEN